MAAVALGTKEVGSIVKLNVNGTPWEFIVVHQGKPGDMYDDSCDGVWLLSKICREIRELNSSSSNNYANCKTHTDLNGDFLNKFDKNIQAVIKQVKIPYCPDSTKITEVLSGGSGLSAKIFLLSCAELGAGTNDNSNFPTEGAKLDYFDAGEDAGAEKRCAENENGIRAEWWTRSPHKYSLSSVAPSTLTVGKYGGFFGQPSGSATYYVRPALILPCSLGVSDDGTISINLAPVTPDYIVVPETIQGGTGLNVTWGVSTDSDDNLAGYELERQVDGGEWAQIHRGPATSYTDAITRGWLTVAYQVRAYDSYGAYSDYTTSPTREVNNNRAPAITCTPASGADLGTKTEGFSVSYSAADADGDPVTVTEAIDGVTLRTFTPEGEGACTCAVTGETFMKLLNGAHELAITASDGQAQAVHTLAFTKSVTAASITLAQPMEADGPITLCVLSVTGSIPEDADYSVKVTNNALDDAPVWEDCTDEVKLGANHVFANDTAANGFAFNFLVSVERGESGQGGYINSVQGGFQ